MRKYSLLIAVLLFGCCIVRAQVAQWVLRPEYDKIDMADGASLLVTDSVRTKAVWTFKGELLFTGEGKILPFREGIAVWAEAHSKKLKGFLSQSGDWFPFEENTYEVAKDFPEFSCGHLLVYDAIFSRYRFIDKQNYLSSYSFIDAYPFVNGYASCKRYLSPEKMKDLRYMLLSRNLEPITFSFKGKVFDPSDIDFVSSVNDQGVCVLVAKNKVYLFHPGQGNLTPVCADSKSDNLKYQAKVQGEEKEWLLRQGDEMYLQAYCGKPGYVVISFDAQLVPTSIRYTDQEKIFQRKEPSARKISSHLTEFMGNWRHGLLWDGAEVLPPQFDAVPVCFDDKAVVKMAGKFGLLKVMPDDKFRVTVYKGKDIPFKHQTFETVLRLDVPAYVPTTEITMGTDPGSGLEVDMTSGEAKETQWGNYVEYNCTLQMPPKLSDEDPEELVYSARVYYTGLTSSVIPVKAKAWHYKYFVVDIIDAETALSNGTLSFTFNINESRDPGEDLYRKRVSVQADSLTISVEKMSEMRYKVKTTELKEGLNNIVIQVIEQGCPPVSFPFEIVYSKPVEEVKGKKTAKEAVVIKKKAVVPYIKM